MTPEEIEAGRIATEEALSEEIANSELTKLQEKLAKAEEDRDNYRKVALQRKGKLPADDEYFKDENELSVAEQVRIALQDSEIENIRKQEQQEKQRLIRENSELRLAIKNKPGSSIGSGGGNDLEVKDNVFNEKQLEELRKRAIRLNVDPEKFIENTKRNLSNR